MPDFEVRVLETITQEKIYTVEAESVEEARALAAKGETVDEDFVRYVEVMDRKILQSPEAVREVDPGPEDEAVEDVSTVFGEPDLITGDGLRWFRIANERQARLAGRLGETAIEHYWRHAHGKLEGSRSNAWAPQTHVWLIALDDHQRGVVTMAALKIGSENAHPRLIADCQVTGFRNDVAFPAYESDIRDVCMALNLVFTPNHMGVDIPRIEDESPSP